METKNNNVKTSHLSDDELLSHSLMYQIVFLLRTIAAQCHMLVPKQLNAIIKRWVGHGLCEVTALPSKLSCPITGKTFLNKDVYKDHYQKNKKKIKKEKKKNNGKKPAPPTDLPKFPDVDWTAFLKADNHHKNVINEVRRSRIGPHIKSSTMWHFSTGALKRIDMDVRPEHCARYASYSGKTLFDVAGRNLREVICHGTNYDQLMALIAWYAIGETSDHNGWCTGVQQKPSVREIRACSIGDTEYNHPVETKAWPVMGNMWGQCHVNALRLLLSEGKGSICVGYHAVRVPCLSFYTILLETHSVYYDGKTYWDATNTGDEMTSDTGLFIPLVMIDKDGNQTNANNRYRTKHSFMKCQILKSYNDQMPLAREVDRLNTQMEDYDGSTDNSVMMEIAEKRDKMNTKLKRETEFFYKAMLGFDDVSEIRYMCRDMCDQAPWLTNPMLIDSTPGMMGRPGLTPISLINVSVRPSPVHGRGLFADKSFKAGNVVFQEHSEGGTLISAPAHISLTELGGVQNNCSFVWSLLMGGHAVNGWIANLCTNPRIVEHMTPKDHELIEYLVDAQTEGRSPEQIEMFRGRLMECFNRLECNQFTVDVPGSVPPLNVMTYVGDKCSKLNHSDEPNCRMQSKFIGTELMFVQAIALRDIIAGEELFIDYGDEYKQKMFEEKKEEEEEVKEVDTLPTIPISRAEEVAARLGGGLNIAAAASIAMEEWCPHCQSLEHPMTKCPKSKYGQYHLDIFNRAKANENHVSNERSESKFKVGDAALLRDSAYRSMTSVEVLEVVYKEKEQQWCYKIKTNRIGDGEKEEWANEEALIVDRSKVKEEASWDSLAKQFQRTTLGQHVAGDGSMKRFARIATMSGVSPAKVLFQDMVTVITKTMTNIRNIELLQRPSDLMTEVGIESYIASCVREKFGEKKEKEVKLDSNKEKMDQLNLHSTTCLGAGPTSKSYLFDIKQGKKPEVKPQSMPTVPISQAEEIAERFGGGLNIAAIASIAIEEWCPHCEGLEHPMTKCPKTGRYHLDIFKANKNHVSNGRSGDDHKRQELEQTSEATGNNQIEFAEAVSRAFDEVRAYGLECTVDRICEATRKKFGKSALIKEDVEYITVEVNKQTATSELKRVVTEVLKCPSGPDPEFFHLPDICNNVCAFINRELIAEEIELVNQMMHLYKRLKCLKSGENEKGILELGITRIQEATKALEARRARSSSNRAALRNQLNICLASRGRPTLDEEEGDERVKKRKRYSEPKPRKSGPAKVKLPNYYVLKEDGITSKEVVEHNQKKLIAFFMVWVQFLEYADKEEEADEIINLAHAMGDKMVMSPVNWGLAERMAEELIKEKKNGEQLWSWASDDFVSSLSGKALYASYENTFVESPDPKRHWEKWEAIAHHENLVDTRIKELRQNWDSDEQKACYEDVIEAENESHPEWRKEIDEDVRVIGVRQEYTLLNGQTLHLENAVKLSGLLRIWAGISGLPKKTVDVTLSIKIMDMEMAMGFTDVHRDRAVAIVDEAFDNISGGVKMMNFVEREEIFLRLGAYYDTFMNISDDAVENFITDYTNNFRSCRAYEWMIVILRQEITQNFCCEMEKESFADRIKELDEQDSEWRDRVNGDWRIKSARGETDDPE